MRTATGYTYTTCELSKESNSPLLIVFFLTLVQMRAATGYTSTTCELTWFIFRPIFRFIFRSKYYSNAHCGQQVVQLQNAPAISCFFQQIFLFLDDDGRVLCHIIIKSSPSGHAHFPRFLSGKNTSQMSFEELGPKKIQCDVGA